MLDLVEKFEPGSSEEDHWLYVLNHHKLCTAAFPYDVVEVAQVTNEQLRSQYETKRKEFQKNVTSSASVDRFSCFRDTVVQIWK